jgi:hypothetical protein
MLNQVPIVAPSLSSHGACLEDEGRAPVQGSVDWFCRHSLATQLGVNATTQRFRFRLFPPGEVERLPSVERNVKHQAASYVFSACFPSSAGTCKHSHLPVAVAPQFGPPGPVK